MDNKDSNIKVLDSIPKLIKHLSSKENKQEEDFNDAKKIKKQTSRSKISKTSKSKSLSAKCKSSDNLKNNIIAQIEEKEIDENEMRKCSKPEVVDLEHKNESIDVPPVVPSVPKISLTNKRLTKVLENRSENDVIVNLRCDNKQKHTAYCSTPSIRRRRLKAPNDVSIIKLQDDN